MNPYSLTFGKEPSEIVPRISQTQTVLRTFTSEQPSQQVYIATGVRGSGKTVFMTSIVKELGSRSDWIVVELNPERDLLQSLAANLYSDQRLSQLFKNAKIDLSLFGISVRLNDSTPISDIEFALQKMLQVMKRSGKRLLVAIDEVSNTTYMRQFASAFQILVRKDYPIFLLMTGLYENIENLQDEDTLTFLYRAPKIKLGPLNIGTIAHLYQKTFQLDPQEALDMAHKTKGYSFAFQVLGYFTWEFRDDTDRIYQEYKQYLEEYVYEKLWSELSANDRKVANAIAHVPSGKISDIRDMLHYRPNQFAPYRDRLIKKGIVDSDGRGMLRFTLPLFDRFVLENYAV